MALPLEDNKNDAASPADDSRIKGNLPPKVKHMLDSVLHELMARPNVFGAAIGERIDITEASIVPKVEESSRSEARVVCEVTVAEDMLNPEGSLHGGCAAFLIDACTTLVFLAAARCAGVSATMNIVYHAPAAPGAKLRIVNSAIAMGARIMSARSEIWDDTAKRLCVTGVHIKMEPSAPKQKQKL
ncbi:HotDog domain-containing protein [Russula ochroleuca]|jgi:acyl-coenzyme A thioesterase 13|uniref:HotDog domain-containing protein n=1 Tax=Russula ochroleuca TaxID=152965 RepID=A0A9P5MMT7_9AGAM|nr:HotDog domain-containing protein [Russula ochroleuca]